MNYQIYLLYVKFRLYCLFCDIMSPINLFVHDIRFRLASPEKRAKMIEKTEIECEIAEIECNEIATKCKQKLKDMIEAGVLSPDVAPPGWLER